MCFEYDCPRPSMFRQQGRRARKQHRCCECGIPILCGEIYQQTFGIWDGGAEVFRTCATCEWLRERVAAAEMESGCHAGEAYPAFRCLYEALSDGHAQSIGLYELKVL